MNFLINLAGKTMDLAFLIENIENCLESNYFRQFYNNPIAFSYIINNLENNNANREKGMNNQGQAKFINGDRQLYENWIIKRQKVVGRGNNPVYQVQDDEGNIECVKEIKLQDNMSEFIFRKQVQLLGKLRNQPHPYIVQCKGSYCLSHKQPLKNRYGYIQMEKGYTNLKEYLSHRKQKKLFFSEDEVLTFVISMLDAFAHLQKIQLAHRDVKPSNIIIFSLDPLLFKICDVGAGTAVGVCDTTENRTVTGTPYYLSPQLLQAYREKKNLTNYKVYKSDSYSLGLVFLQFMTLQRIEQRQFNEAQRIQTAILQVKKRYPNIVGLGKVLRRMLDMNVKTRMDFLQLQAYINQSQLLRNKINSQIQLDPLLINKLTSEKQIKIQKFEDLANLSKIINSGNQVPIVNIQLSSPNGLIKKHEKDTIEEIKNIKHMNIQQFYIKATMCELGDKQAEYIATAISKNIKLRVIQVDLWNNQMKNQGFIRILSEIHNVIQNIEELTLMLPNNCIRIDKSFGELFDLSKAQKLKKLHLNLSFNEISSDYLQVFMKGISKAPSIQQINLNLQKIKMTHIYVNKAMKQIQKMNTLRYFSLNISSNQVRDEGLFGISNAMESLSQLQQLHFIARYAEIGDKGFSEFTKSLANLTTLKRLKINFINNLFTENGLKTGLPSIGGMKQLNSIDINISGNRINFLGAKWLCNHLLPLKQLKKLRLILDSTEIGMKGCLYIGRLISQLSNLNELELSLKQNQIQVDGIKYICQGLLSTKRIKRLKIDLTGTRIGDYAANYLAKYLLKIRTLASVDLNMQNCQLGQATMQNITKLVKQCSRKAEQITISMRKNRQIRMQLYEQIKKQLSNSRVAVRVDQPTTSLNYSTTN